MIRIRCNEDSLHKDGWFKGTTEICLLFGLKMKGLLCSNFNDRNLTCRGTDWNGYFKDRYEKGPWGGYSLTWPIRGCICAARQGMVFELSVLNRVYNFERVCSNCKQGIGCTIDLYDMLDKICVSCKYTKQGTLICSIAIANIKLL